MRPWDERAGVHTKRVAVIGAGPTGMATAYALAKAGVVAHVYEAGAQVGGLTRSFKLWDELVDLGPHLFEGFDPAAFALWKEVVGNNVRMLRRDTRIVIGGRVYRQPLQPGEMLRGLGMRGALRAGLGYASARIAPRGPCGSAERFLVRRFGTHLYAFFYRPYCRKLWGRDPSEVDETLAAAILPDHPTGRTLVGATPRRLVTREQALPTSFPYAVEGAGAFCTRAAARIAQLGGSVRLSATVTRVLSVDRNVTGIGMGNARYAYDWVVSSMPLAALLRGLTDDVPPAVGRALSRLRFRSTILVYLRVRGRGTVPHLWMYVDEAIRAGRITNFARWQGAEDADAQTIAVEYWCDDDDPLLRSDDATLRALAERELSAVAGVQPPRAVDDAHVCRIRASHPVYHRGYLRDLSRVCEHLATYAGLSVITRDGLHAHDAQPRALEVGLQTARSVLESLGLPRPSTQLDQELNASD